MTTFDLQRAANRLHWLWHGAEVQYTVLTEGAVELHLTRFTSAYEEEEETHFEMLLSHVVEEVNVPLLDISKTH